MQVKNNYDITWEKENSNKEEGIEYGSGVFNGEIGTITQINESEKSITIKFDDEKVAIYEYSDLEQIEHSYAITIHKAQGSEFDVVIMCVPRTAPILLTRNLLYTGITRAQEASLIMAPPSVKTLSLKAV
jgi:exodeoxyribonuclease V alpha subunit